LIGIRKPKPCRGYSPWPDVRIFFASSDADGDFTALGAILLIYASPTGPWAGDGIGQGFQQKGLIVHNLLRINNWWGVVAVVTSIEFSLHASLLPVLAEQRFVLAHPVAFLH